MNLRIRYNHWIPKLINVNAIVLYPWVLFAESNPSERTIQHEFIHVEQVRRVGWLNFYLSYLLYYFANRLYFGGHEYSYSAIPAEIEAYSRTAEVKDAGV